MSTEYPDKPDAKELGPNREEALLYINDFLPPLRKVAANADLTFITYLLDMAAEETNDTMKDS